jgi:hypothetical protein
MRMRILGLGIVSLLAAGCGIGDDGKPQMMGLGVICSSPLTITGTFTQGAARPIDSATGMPLDGCWPDGTWTFMVQVGQAATGGCTPAPTPLASYTFSDHRTDPDGTGDFTMDNFTYAPDSTWPNYHVKVSENATGCEGSLELFSPDGKKVWGLVPEVTQLNGQNTLGGEGDYTEYDSVQWNPDST